MSYFRKPKTKQEMTANKDDDAKYGRQRNLPNSWDDLNVGSRKIRSWKKFRKTRYR